MSLSLCVYTHNFSRLRTKRFLHEIHLNRVLGNFEKPIFLELCKYMETKIVHVGHHLFKVGDPDDSIYVVQTGEITVSIREPVSEHTHNRGRGTEHKLHFPAICTQKFGHLFFQDNKEHVVKVVKSGDSIHSLLSIMDILTVSTAMACFVLQIVSMSSFLWSGVSDSREAFAGDISVVSPVKVVCMMISVGRFFTAFALLL